jgi:hypothetical protein
MSKLVAIYSYGMVISPTPYDGGVFYAELVPAGSIYGKQYLRRFLPNVGKWWFEVNYLKNGECAHLYTYDGGAFTFHKAVRRAMDAVDLVLSEQEKKKKKTLQPSKERNNE